MLFLGCKNWTANLLCPELKASGAILLIVDLYDLTILIPPPQGKYCPFLLPPLRLAPFPAAALALSSSAMLAHLSL
jgi:hypothetical protein